MCGRFTLTTPTEELAAHFEVPDPPLLSARYNVAPSQLIAVIGLKQDGKTRGLAQLRWGLVPHWTNDLRSEPHPINVRAESALFKFGDLLRGRRCMIPADGFYEWLTVGKKKLPHRFTMLDGAPFAFAGLWDVWKGEGKKLLTCAIITTTANPLVAALHDRMPVILDSANYSRWLAPETPTAELESLLRPYPSGLMKVAAANPLANSPKHDGPECLAAGPPAV